MIRVSKLPPQSEIGNCFERKTKNCRKLQYTLMQIVGRTRTTGGLELLARELLASHWNYWPSIGTIGHQNSAYFFVGTIGQKKNSEEVPKFRGFLTGKTLFTPPFIVSTVQIWTYQRTLYRLLPFKGVVVVFYKPLDNFHGHILNQRGRLP